MDWGLEMKNTLPATYETYSEFDTSFGHEMGHLNTQWYSDNNVTKEKFIAAYTNNRVSQIVVFSVEGIYAIDENGTEFIKYNEIEKIRANASTVFEPNPDQLKLNADSLVIWRKSGDRVVVFFDGQRGPDGFEKDAYSVWHLIGIFDSRFG